MLSIEIYNKYMGGTERMDENINYYRIGIRDDKWWWCLFTWMVDASMHNAWQIARRRGESMTHLDFRREVAIVMLFSCLYVHIVIKA